MWAFAFGAWTGVRMMLMFSLASRASNGRGNFASRSWIRNPHLAITVVEIHQQVARLLQHPGGIRPTRASDVLDAATADGDEGEHVEAAQPDRVDGEEVAGEDRLAMRS